jgi:hypothetical protein
MLVGWSVGWSVRPSVGWLVCPHITLKKTGYVAISSHRGEGRGNQVMSKTGYVEIALRLVTVHPFLIFSNYPEIRTDLLRFFFLIFLISENSGQDQF